MTNIRNSLRDVRRLLWIRLNIEKESEDQEYTRYGTKNHGSYQAHVVLHSGQRKKRFVMSEVPGDEMLTSGLL